MPASTTEVQLVQYAFLVRGRRSGHNGAASPRWAGTTPDYDDREFVFTGDTSKVSGNLKAIPIFHHHHAEDTKTLRVLPRTSAATQPKTASTKEDWTR